MIGNDCVNHSVSDRDCSHCIWHTDGRCASWDCEYISRKEALEALEKIKEMESAQSDVPDINVGDTISRRKAIDDLHGKDPSQIWDTADIEVWVNALPSVTLKLLNIDFLMPESELVFYDNDHGFCINTQDVLEHIERYVQWER